MYQLYEEVSEDFVMAVNEIHQAVYIKHIDTSFRVKILP